MSVYPAATLAQPSLNVMNFLNEVPLWYPNAISFAPGRPVEQLFDLQPSLTKIERFVEHYAAQQGHRQPFTLNHLGQYQKTNGIINDLIARMLANDENIHVPPEAIMITDGCQEAMLVLLLGLFNPTTDVLLVTDPTYIGITGVATLCGIEIVAIPSPTPDRLALAAIEYALGEIRARGKNPKALYLIPDFNNPLGTTLSLSERQLLLALARKQGLLLIEDNAYGMFAYDEQRAPTLKSLGQASEVLYIGTFSKTLYPGLRVGFLVADQPMQGKAATTLAAELSKVKSLTSVNTSPLLQAIVGGILLEEDCTLRRLTQHKCTFYRAHRDAILAALAEHVERDPLLADQVSWSRPKGGFFLTVALPFELTEQLVWTCARDYQVIVSPMTFFSLLGSGKRQARLAFSYTAPETIREGIRRFTRFVHDTYAALPHAEGHATPAPLE